MKENEINDVQINDGFVITYAKKGGTPKYTWLDNRRQVIGFIVDNMNDLDLLCINDVVIQYSPKIRTAQRYFVVFIC